MSKIFAQFETGNLDVAYEIFAYPHFPYQRIIKSYLLAQQKLYVANSFEIRNARVENKSNNSFFLRYVELGSYHFFQLCGPYGPTLSWSDKLNMIFLHFLWTEIWGTSISKISWHWKKCTRITKPWKHFVPNPACYFLFHFMFLYTLHL